MSKEEMDIKFAILEELRVILQVKPGESITAKAKEIMEVYNEVLKLYEEQIKEDLRYKKVHNSQ